MLFEYRKFGTHYRVSEKHTYDADTKEYKLTYLGTVIKENNRWIGTTKNGSVVIGPTRKNASEKMLNVLEKGINAI